MKVCELPTDSPLTAHAQNARLPPHRGSARFSLGGTVYSGFAELLLPADGQAIIAFHTTAEQTLQDFGTDLVIDGTGKSGPFRIECPRCYVYRQIEHVHGHGGWCLISPVNSPARVQYGLPRSAARATVLLNNFDYTYGDSVTSDQGLTRIGAPLTVDIGGRRVTFRHHHLREEILPLVKAEILHAASLTEFSVDVTSSESDDEVMSFCADVASLCTFVSGAGVSVAMLDLLDRDAAIARRVIPQPVISRFRRSGIVDDTDIAEFFHLAFDEYVTMKRIHPAWRRLASHCGSLEDAPYLEQKFASLVMALEFLMRNCLLEKGQPEAWVSKLDFLGLIGAARKHLGWDIPKHYVARHTVRLLRNAVMHGGELPTQDSREFRLLFDKWRLFLFRHVLTRLGYRGKVVSPHKGWRSSSDVADFSEEHNSFPADPETDSWMRFIRQLREQRASTPSEQS
jgi:hypothetical protein